MLLIKKNMFSKTGLNQSLFYHLFHHSASYSSIKQKVIMHYPRNITFLLKVKAASYTVLSDHSNIAQFYSKYLMGYLD